MEFNQGNPRPPMTVAEYVAFEEASSVCHEYLGGDVYPVGEQHERKVYRHWRDDERLWWSDTVVRDRRFPIRCLDTELSLEDIYGNLPETG